MEESFSRKVKSELLKSLPRSLSERQALVAGLFLSQLPPSDALFASSYKVKSADRSPESIRSEEDFVTELLKLTEFSFEKRALKSGVEISVTASSKDEFDSCFSMCFTEKSADILSSSSEFVRYFLKGVYISCGYLSDPEKTYRIELHCANPNIVELMLWMFNTNEIESSVSVRGNKRIIRMRSGDSIATFLALIGATNSYLEFESIRISRDFKGGINRAVNCDLGNSRRQAEAGARRTDLFERLLASPESSKLPKELRDAAQVHIDNPGASIAELGRMMDPPISKSGMNHRLIKLEELARELK